MNNNQSNSGRAFLKRQGELLKTYRQKLDEIRGIDKKEEARVEKILWEAEILYEEQAYNQRFFDFLLEKKNELEKISTSIADDETKERSTKIINDLSSILAEGERIDQDVRRLKRTRIWRIIKLWLFPFWRD